MTKEELHNHIRTHLADVPRPEPSTLRSMAQVLKVVTDDDIRDMLNPPADAPRRGRSRRHSPDVRADEPSKEPPPCSSSSPLTRLLRTLTTAPTAASVATRRSRRTPTDLGSRTFHPHLAGTATMG